MDCAGILTTPLCNVISSPFSVKYPRIFISAISLLLISIVGDTGTNMSLTMQSAIRELKACTSNNLHDLAEAVSKGALKGARGNSGVITSQIFRGLCAILKDKADFDTKTFAKAFKNATDVAYSRTAGNG